MSRLRKIPLSVIIVFFAYVLLYGGSLASIDTWLAIAGGVMIPITAVLIWFDFAKPNEK